MAARARGVLVRHWPLAGALLLLWLVLLACLVAATAHTDGHLVYALDDAYIHLAISQQLYQHGVWGVTVEGFTPSASSLLWPVLVAGGLWLTGNSDLVPFVLNFLFASLACVFAYVVLARHGAHPALSFAALVAIVLCTPLPALVFGGMEHSLQVLVVLAFLYLAATFLAAEAPTRERTTVLAGVAFLVTATRYEGLLAVAVVVAALLLRGRLRAGIWVAAAGALPVAAFGAVSLAEGWHFLPNSVLVKSASHLGLPASLREWARALGGYAVRNLYRAPHLMFLAFGTVAVLWGLRVGKDRRVFWLGALYLPTLVLHAQFARLGWFYRYEAYLVAAGILAIAVGLAGTRLPRAVSLRDPVFRRGAALGALLLPFAVAPFAVQAASLRHIPRASANIYEQQYQMALFLREHYPGARVAANDIGAISYLASIRLVDLVGLANRETAQARIESRVGPDTIRHATRGAQIAIVYDSWFKGQLPPEWTPVGRWRISDNVVCGDDTVSFYAVDPAEVAPLEANLRAFAHRLPDDVTQSGPYNTS